MSPLYRANAALGVWEAPGRPSIVAGDRSGLVSGTYEPSLANTGVLPGVALTTYVGDMIVTTPGTLVQNMDVYGRIIIRAADVTVRNCRVRGTSGNSNRGLFDCTHDACVRFTAYDCTLIPDYPSYGWNAIMGHDYHLVRCMWKWTVDGCRGYNLTNPGAPLNITVEGCYGGPTSFFSPDPNHAPPRDNRVHSDHFQIESGMAGNHSASTPWTWVTANTSPSVTILGNALWGWYAGGDLFPEHWPTWDGSVSDPLTNPPNAYIPQLRDANTSLIQVTPNLGVPVTGLVVSKNYCHGGGVGVSLAGGGGSGQRNPGIFTDNIFDGQQRSANLYGTANAWCFSIKSPEYGNRDVPELLGTFTGNINTASGGAARLGRVTA
jgi:hypothetical protein